MWITLYKLKSSEYLEEKYNPPPYSKQQNQYQLREGQVEFYHVPGQLNHTLHSTDQNQQEE